jgi:4-hydroxy-4-methyl-2-oxoglutarate aldolase
MPSFPSAEEIQVLKRYSSPTLANAIELFDLRPRNAGFMSPDIRCIFPSLGVMVGFACTATIRAERPASDPNQTSRYEYWKSILGVPAPRVAVIQDLDNPVGVGSFWGEVNGNIHCALECIGTVTNGGVRDLDEVRNLGFHLFASGVVVSHAYIHLVEIEVPVNIGGVIVNPGDLIHADQHGVLIVPKEIVRELPEAVKKIEAKERTIIDLCQSPSFSIERLKELL